MSPAPAINETSLTISTQETPLLHNDQQQHSSPPKQPRIKNLKAKTFFLLRILIVLIVGFIILYSIYSNNQKPAPRNSYLSGLSKYYCHLTRHPKLCHDSMRFIITNVTALEPNPARIFTASLQLIINELNHTSISITKALPSPASNTSLIRPTMSTCQTLVNDSLSHLNKSLGLLGVDLFFGSLIPYVEEQNIRDEIQAVKSNIRKCLWGLREIDRAVMVDDEDDQGVGVEEVKMGVKKAGRLVDNFISLFDRRHSILDDFYNPYRFNENEGYNYLYNYYFYFDYYGYGFDYGSLVCVYGVMYLFIGLLYFLFWQQ